MCRAAQCLKLSSSKNAFTSRRMTKVIWDDGASMREGDVGSKPHSMWENGRALWAPRRGYSPGIRVPQTEVTCGLSAIAVRSVCFCASIQGGGADAHTTAVDRVRSHREEPGRSVPFFASPCSLPFSRLCVRASYIAKKRWWCGVLAFSAFLISNGLNLGGAFLFFPAIKSM